MPTPDETVALCQALLDLVGPVEVMRQWQRHGYPVPKGWGLVFEAIADLSVAMNLVELDARREMDEAARAAGGN